MNTSPADKAVTPPARDDGENGQKLDFVDSLRGLAILLVILVHTSQRVEGIPGLVKAFCTYGQMGVQLFFMASGFTLCLSLSRRSSGAGSGVRNFYIRRFFRIAPLYFCGFLLYQIIVPSLSWTPLVAPDPLGAPFWLKALTFFTFTNGFFVDLIDIVPGGWSIVAEMTFYIVTPFLFLRISSLRGAVAAFLASIPLSLLAYKLLGDIGVESSFYRYTFVVTQLPSFLAGFLFYHIYTADFFKSRLNRLSQEKLRLWGYGGILLSFLGFIALAVLFQNRTVVAIYPFAVIFLALAVSLAAHPTRLIVNPVIRQIGVVSFSAYITHFFVLYVLKAVMNVLPLGGVPALLQLIVLFITAVAVTYCLSLLTYKAIEAPGQAWGKAVIRRLNQKVAVKQAS